VARAAQGGYGEVSRDGGDEEGNRPDVEKFCFVLFFVFILECLLRMYTRAPGQSSKSGGTCQGRRQASGDLAAWHRSALAPWP
jgi:hypothetical protein